LAPLSTNRDDQEGPEWKIMRTYATYAFSIAPTISITCFIDDKNVRRNRSGQKEFCKLLKTRDLNIYAVANEMEAQKKVVQFYLDE